METISDLENVGRQRRRRSAGTSRHFRRSYLKTNKVKKVKGQGMLNMYIIFETTLMPFTQNYQNYFVLVDTTACQSWRVF